jgi:hypothetical protein
MTTQMRGSGVDVMAADLQERTWKALREYRLAHGGAFAWYMQCREHGVNYDARCLSCGMVEEHNFKIREELRRDVGEWAYWLNWPYEEPVADIPMTRSEYG